METAKFGVDASGDANRSSSQDESKRLQAEHIMRSIKRVGSNNFLSGEVIATNVIVLLALLLMQRQKENI